jgi:hypothetical protein
MEAILRRQNIPHRRFTDAGQYVCESTFWTLLDFAAMHSPQMRAGFLHVPAISDAWPAERVAEVVRETVERIPPSRGDAVRNSKVLSLRGRRMARESPRIEGTVRLMPST